MDAAALAAHYRRLVDPSTDPMPVQRRRAWRFISQHRERADDDPDELWSRFLAFAKQAPEFTGVSGAQLEALWSEVCDIRPDVALPKQLSPVAQFVWLAMSLYPVLIGGEVGEDAMRLQLVMVEAMRRLWPMNVEQAVRALAEAMEELIINRDTEVQEDLDHEIMEVSLNHPGIRFGINLRR